MLVPVVFFVALGLAENALLRRRAILSAYLTTELDELERLADLCEPATIEPRTIDDVLDA